MKVQIAPIGYWELGEVVDKDFRKGIDSQRILRLWCSVAGLSGRLLDVVDGLFLSAL